MPFENQANSQTDIKNEIQEPRLYEIVLHNDHYTTTEFVVEVLRTIFHKELAEATQIMLDVHKKGKGRVGLYPRDIAETKALQVSQMARAAEFPLKCSVEPV